MVFLYLRKCYHTGMLSIMVRKFVFHFSHFVQQFKEVGRTMEVCVQELIKKYTNYYQDTNNYSK
jgi:hypothetical protein